MSDRSRLFESRVAPLAQRARWAGTQGVLPGQGLSRPETLPRFGRRQITVGRGLTPPVRPTVSVSLPPSPVPGSALAATGCGVGALAGVVGKIASPGARPALPGPVSATISQGRRKTLQWLPK